MHFTRGCAALPIAASIRPAGARNGPAPAACPCARPRPAAARAIPDTHTPRIPRHIRGHSGAHTHIRPHGHGTDHRPATGHARWGETNTDHRVALSRATVPHNHPSTTVDQPRGAARRRQPPARGTRSAFISHEKPGKRDEAPHGCPACNTVHALPNLEGIAPVHIRHLSISEI